MHSPLITLKADLQYKIFAKCICYNLLISFDYYLLIPWRRKHLTLITGKILSDFLRTYFSASCVCRFSGFSFFSRGALSGYQHSISPCPETRAISHAKSPARAKNCLFHHHCQLHNHKCKIGTPLSVIFSFHNSPLPCFILNETFR